MIHKISFENYKVFKEPQDLIIKPITVLIGKNSSGKSALVRMIMMVLESLSPDSDSIEDALIYKTSKFDVAGNFRDLLHKRDVLESLNISIDLDGPGGGIDTFSVKTRYFEELKKGIIDELTLKE
jgi:AAA15 family ATPase/GTPase